MPRAERGILGMKKDPKKRTLFSVGRKFGDWPQSDSEDSDYEPESESLDASIPKKKSSPTNSKNSPRGSRKKAKLSATCETNATPTEPSITQTPITNNQVWSELIPSEVLMEIFHKVVQSEGALPFLVRASKVCTSWNKVAKHPSLWVDLDFSYGWIKSCDKTLKDLCPRRMSRTKRVNLTMWKKLTYAGLEAVCQNCPDLTSINLSNCKHVNGKCVKLLADTYSRLTSINLTAVDNDAVSKQTLAHFLASPNGTTLKEINLSNCQLAGFQNALSLIATTCTHLEVFEVCNATFSSDFATVDVEKMQHGCPNLRILRLTNSKFRASIATAMDRASSPGWPKLAELSLAINTNFCMYSIGIDDTVLHRFLKSSHKLKLLDLRGTEQITAAGIHNLPMENLEDLFISQSSIAKYNGIEAIMQKWQHSLRVLDVSWNMYPGMSLDQAMKKLASDPAKSKLESLNLSGTAVSCRRIEALLKGCPKLKSLNLMSCRGLNRGMKREYAGSALDKLREDLANIIEENEDYQIELPVLRF